MGGLTREILEGRQTDVLLLAPFPEAQIGALSFDQHALQPADFFLPEKADSVPNLVLHLR